MNRRVAIYARYSTDRQDARSIEDQERRCRAYAATAGDEVVETFKDAAESGAHIERADMQRLLLAVRATRRPPFEVVLVDDLSRLSRDLGNTWRIVFEELASANVIVVDVATGMASDGAGARLTFGAMALVNDHFLQLVRTETHRGLEGRALTGFATGGKTYGYASIEEENPPDPEHPRRRIIVDAAEAEVVKRVFHLFAAGMALKKIAALLNEEGIAAPHDSGRGHKIGRGWPHGTIRAMLLNERYIGRQTWNRSKWVRVPGKKARKQVERPKAEWIVKDVPELRIVPEDLWREVQGRFRRRSTSKRGRPAGTGKFVSLLSGLMRCGVCGGSMTVVSRKMKAGVVYSGFGCTTHAQRGDSVCPNAQTVSDRRASAAIIGALRLALNQPAMVKRFTEGFLRRLEEIHGGQGEAEKALDKKIRETEGRLRRIVESIASHGYSAVLGDTLRQDEQHLESLKQQRGELLRDTPGRVVPHPSVIEAYLSDLLSTLETDVVRGRELLVKHLTPVVMTPEKDGEERWYRATGAFNLSVVINSRAENSTAPGLESPGAVKCSSGG